MAWLGLLAQRAPQPHVIVRVLARSRFTACWHSVTACAHCCSVNRTRHRRFWASAAPCAGCGQRREQGEGLVGLAGLQVRVGLGQSCGRNLRACRNGRGHRQAHHRQDAPLPASRLTGLP